jgi:hypothetical protein
MTPVPGALLELVRLESSRPVPPEVRALAAQVVSRHARAAQAVLFYGSWLRGGSSDGFADLCLLVDRYRAAYDRWLPAAGNWLLPPNVFSLEVSCGARTFRAKYAVVTLRAFERGTSTRRFESYLWARFAQPSRLVYARDEGVAERTRVALATAAVTFTRRVVPLMPRVFEAAALWRRGLQVSYGTELRAERPEAVARVIDAAPAYYAAVTAVLAPTLALTVVPGRDAAEPRYQYDPGRGRRWVSTLAWAARRCHGKLLSCARLLKGLATFEGGPEYVAWKVARHSGVEIELTPGLRRRPWLVGWLVAWRLLRRGGVR